MIKIITGKLGEEIAVVEGDTHLSKWVEEQGRLCCDDTVKTKLCPLLKQGDVVIDAGASLGDHTLAYSAAVGEYGIVLAFEPMRETFQCLAFNTIKHKNIYAYNLGLSHSFDICHMIRDDNIGMAHIDVGLPDTKWHEPVLTIPIDALQMPRLNLFKLDVEGYEYRVLLGAEKTIMRCRPIIYCELNKLALSWYGYSVNDIVEMLARWGYKLTFLEPGYSLDDAQTDALFIPI